MRTTRAGWLLAALLTCQTALAVDTPPSDDLPDISHIRALVYSEDFEAAVAELTPLTAQVHHADLYNLLGFSLRRLGRHEASARAYEQALVYDPAHRHALQYQAELFLTLGQVDAALTNRRYLALLCGDDGCGPLEQLDRALIAHGVTPPG